ncbi:ABC transporter substrate-binding protein [Arsenicitalea aurantiaca]|uniref:ABC transporter substrate-binding protein n=1 Tax=Arsenicitalea aurantiaca TaxID=1783274 RepID=A0A433XLS9_9HYPH|nr:ABC transporter substrate-binding protein [Arsenicitalea aurantiaca]RUT35047.1 ABC transporter substrate-binding protein [Arsenicitalea aurantiaca]
MTNRIQRLLFVLAASFLLAFGISGAQAQEDARPPFVFAVDGLWPTLDPVIGISTTGGRVHTNIFDTLVRRNYDEDPEGNTLVPGLAESWERTSPTVWTLTLREGVLFHNGEEMTSEDVAFSLSAERLWGEEPMAPRGSNFARGLVRVEATGPYTVELETEFPDATFIARLTTAIGFVLPKAYYEEVGTDAFGQAPIGTGPYQLTEFDPSERAVAVAFDEYWGEPAPFSQVTWLVVPEFSTRLAGLASGQYDLIINVPIDQQDVVASTPGVKLLVNQVGNYPMFAFNTLTVDGMDDNPLQDANLRKAMVAAIDMNEITEALWDGQTFTPTPFNFPEYGDYYDAEREAAIGYDRAQAEAYLDASDYNGETLIWHVVRGFFDNYETAAEFMIEEWRDLGINVEMRILDNFALAYERPFHLLNMSMSSEFTGDPYRPLWLDWGPSSSRVTASHRTWEPSEAFLEAGERFERAEEFEERNAAYLDLVAAWEDVTPGMYLWRNLQTFAMREDLDWTPGNTQVTVFDARFVDPQS